MKMREMIRRSCYATAVTLLCFGPGAFAQSKLASPVSAAVRTRSVGVVVFNPIVDDWKSDKKKKKKVAAAEGGSAALYLVLAGLACGGAVLLRSRRPLAEKSA